MDKELALITARARDAVATFLSTGYLLDKITQIERKAGVPVTHPDQTVRQVAKAAKFSDEMADAILGPLHPRRPADRGRRDAGRDQRRPDPG